MRVVGWLARPCEILGAPPALAAALPCAALAVVGLALLQRCLATRVGPWPATVAVVLVGISPPMLRHAYEAEVWGPLIAAAGAFAWLASGDHRRPISPFIVGLALGLAVTVHLSAVLWVPLAVAGAWPRAEPAPSAPSPSGSGVREVLHAGLTGLAGSALGLSFFGTLALGRGGAWRWGDTQSVSGLIHHVSRADYGVLSLSLHTERPAFVASWHRHVLNLADALFAGVPATVDPGAGTVGTALAASLLVLVVAGWIAHRRSMDATPRQRRIDLGWAGVLVMHSVVFVALGNIDPSSFVGSWILERFDLAALIAWSWPLAHALAWIDARVQAGAARARPATVIAAAVLASVSLARGWPGRPAADRGVQAYGVDLVGTPPDGSVVFGTDDHRIFPALFAKAVLGRGGSTVYVDASLLSYPWYRAWLAEQRPDIDWRPLPLETVATMWADPALAQTPIYLANHFSRPSRELAVAPEGVLWRVLPPPQVAAPPGPAQLVARHRAALARSVAHPSQFAGLLEPELHPFSADAWAAYLDRAGSLRAGLAAGGRPDLVEVVDHAWDDKFGSAAKSPP